jgi:DNA-binding winged helix-turn-helix (wHTH) protein/predicted ATPase
VYAFGEFVLDPQLFQLRLRAQVIALEPKVFDVLHYLIANSDRVVTRQELLSSLWPNEVVTEAVLPTNINVLRRALGQKRGERTPIETVHGRGYRFALPVQHTQPEPRRSERAPDLHMLAAGTRSDFPEDATFVGRSALLERLLASFGEAQRGHGQVCLLNGEAGIGKTRLASRVADIARARGADVWLGVCPEGMGTPTLWIWQQMLRCALTSEGRENFQAWVGDPRASVSTWPSELAGVERAASRNASQPSAGEGREAATFRMLDAVQRVLVGASAARPRVLLLEDMHRADLASWNLLRLLSPQLEQLAVLVLATVRGRDDLTVYEPVRKHLGELSRMPGCHAFYVRGLSEAESTELLTRVLGRGLGALARKLHMKAEGNPLFLRELADALAENPQIEQAIDEAQGFEPPEVVRHVLRRRVSRLGENAYQMLEAASVFATSWDVKNLERVTGMDRTQVLSTLDVALQQRIVLPMPGLDTYRFSHDLVRDTLRADLTTQAKKRFHLLAAAACEECLPWRGREGVRELAHHLYQALPEGDAGRAIAWLERAAEAAEETLDLQDAALLYRFALDATRFLPEPRPDLQAKLREALTRVGTQG